MASSGDKEKIDLNSEEINVDDNLKTVDEQENKTPSTKSSPTNDLHKDSVAATETFSDGKISVYLKATSDVPIIKKQKWQVDENKTVYWVISFIKKYLKLDDKDTIFLYVSQAFAPSPDQQIKNLYECFGSDNKLVLHYSKNPAWG